MLSLATFQGWLVYQMDVRSSFVHGDLHGATPLVLCRIFQLFGGFGIPCMVSNKLLELGRRRWIVCFLLIGSTIVIMILQFELRDKDLIY